MSADRIHTFMFADLAGFTDFTENHGDERAADLAVNFHGRVRALASEHHCEVVKDIGDAVMVRSDETCDALSLAARILRLSDEEDYPPVRVGVDTGPAIERNGDWFGSTVNTAARVTAAAGAGELLMTERARNAATRLTELEVSHHGWRGLKGLPAAVLYAGALLGAKG